MIRAGLLLLALGAAPAGAVVARVDGVEITAPAVAERAEALKGTGGPVSAEGALDSLVLETLAAADARRLGLDRTVPVKERIARERGRLAAGVLLSQQAASIPKPDDAELRAQFHQTADSAAVRVRVFPSEDAARVAFALVEKSGNLDDAGRAPVPGFEPVSSQGEKIRGSLPPELAEKVFSVPVGKPAGPFQLGQGWAILLVSARTVGDEAEFAAKRERIAAFVAEKQAGAMRDHLREQLRRRAKVSVDQPFLDAISKRGAPTAAELTHVVATVNGDSIRLAEVDEAIQGLGVGFGHGGTGLRVQALDTLIGDRLVAQAAMERKLHEDPSVVAKMPAVERWVLANAWVERAGADARAPSEKEIKDFYKANVASTGQTLDATRAAISQRLLEQRRAELAAAKARELRARAQVDVDRAALAQALPR